MFNPVATRYTPKRVKELFSFIWPPFESISVYIESWGRELQNAYSILMIHYVYFLGLLKEILNGFMRFLSNFSLLSQRNWTILGFLESPFQSLQNPCGDQMNFGLAHILGFFIQRGMRKAMVHLFSSLISHLILDPN